MNENENRKSMDDVLASIRRIVRAEREPQDVEAVPVDAGSVEAMIADDIVDTRDVVVEQVATAAAFVSAPEPLEDAIVPPPAAEAAPAIDEESLRALVREIVLEELADGQGMDLVREIIKAELTTGEIGGNISRNVLRLIRSEIAKASG